MTTALVFPGQGSQAPGMGKDIFDNFTSAKEVFQEIDDALNQKLSKLIFEGSSAELDLTENTQPALMAVSLSIMKVLENDFNFKFDNKINCVAGHSLGEYSALTAAKTFTISDCAKLLRTRGKAMQQAAPVGVGAMAAIIGLEYEDVEKVTTQASTPNIWCSVANDNCPGQIVISGHSEAVLKAMEIAKEHGARKTLQLAVSAPFHCALMAPAANIMKDALENTQMNRPIKPLIANVTAEAIDSPETIKTQLIEQITGRVRWRESVLTMENMEVTKIYEIGAGKVLSGLIKRTAPSIECVAINTISDVEQIAKELQR